MTLHPYTIWLAGNAAGNTTDYLQKLLGNNLSDSPYWIVNNLESGQIRIGITCLSTSDDRAQQAIDKANDSLHLDASPRFSSLGWQ